MNSIERRITELETQVKNANTELSKIQKLRETFPDLEMSTDRWGKIRYFAESANKQVTDFYTKHACGCCNDSPLYAYPYLTVEGIQVHSKPDHFCIGEKNAWGYGEIYNPDSVEVLRKASISEEILKRVELIVAQTPSNYDDDNDNDYYESNEND